MSRAGIEPATRRSGPCQARILRSTTRILVPKPRGHRPGPRTHLISREARAPEYGEGAAALDDDFPLVLAALRRGLSDKDARKAAAVAVFDVQLVYGRQLQQPLDEQPTDPLDISAMTREQRDALKRKILACTLNSWTSSASSTEPA